MRYLNFSTYLTKPLSHTSVCLVGTRFLSFDNSVYDLHLGSALMPFTHTDGGKLPCMAMAVLDSN